MSTIINVFVKFVYAFMSKLLKLQKNSFATDVKPDVVVSSVQLSVLQFFNGTSLVDLKHHYFAFH